MPRASARKASRIKVRNLGGEIVIEANAAGLKTLAGHSDAGWHDHRAGPPPP
ncbi:hypothetical protein GTY82_33040 [Streptomyces sp. SID5476]|uniref:Uncharacterized protein n=1 Tax=Streptomyces bottropensis ATCC 25435 TaxID=1054862 RepID=M3FLF7_9ACTN|nr:hypothetical protein SBD_5990 [Streptomyces bottropensis ATCC 25435]MZD21973.1 hypothetical protein [Streptomyces sp. SID5476]